MYCVWLCVCLLDKLGFHIALYIPPSPHASQQFYGPSGGFTLYVWVNKWVGLCVCVFACMCACVLTSGVRLEAGVIETVSWLTQQDRSSLWKYNIWVFEGGKIKSCICNGIFIVSHYDTVCSIWILHECKALWGFILTRWHCLNNWAPDILMRLACGGRGEEVCASMCVCACAWMLVCMRVTGSVSVPVFNKSMQVKSESSMSPI